MGCRDKDGKCSKCNFVSISVVFLLLFLMFYAGVGCIVSYYVLKHAKDAANEARLDDFEPTVCELLDWNAHD